MYLGEPSNDYGHDVQIEVDTGQANFIQFDSDTKTISFPANSTTESDIGTYTIRIHLHSASLDVQEDFDIKLNVFPAPEKPEVEFAEKEVKKESASYVPRKGQALPTTQSIDVI